MTHYSCSKNPLPKHVIQEIQRQALIQVDGNASKFNQRCFEIALGFPHFASSTEIANTFGFSYGYVSKVVNAYKDKQRALRDKNIAKKNKLIFKSCRSI